MLPMLTNVQEINTICPLSAVSASSESASFDLQFVDSVHAEPVYTEVILYYIILYKRLENLQIFVSMMGGGKRRSQNYLPTTEG